MLKGKTIIELTDVNTGKKETYEDHNMVTQAINEIILKRKRYLYPSTSGTGEYSDIISSFYNMFPLYKRFFGGMLLFQNNIDESRMFISGDDVVIGSATFNNAYSGLDPQIGSYNQAESEINTEEKYIKFVYDFATNQGNGTISSVCLANNYYVYNALYGKSYEGDYEKVALENLLFSCNSNEDTIGGAANKPNMCLFPSMRQTSSFEAKTGYETPLVYDEEKGHLITAQFVSSVGVPSWDNVIDRIKLNVYDLGLNKVTLFGGYVGDYYKSVEPILIFEKEFTIPTCGNYSQYNMQTNYNKFGYYDKSDGCAYIIGDSKKNTLDLWAVNEILTMFKFDLNVESYENITMETIEMTNKSGYLIYITTTWKSQRMDCKYILVHNGYLYAPTDGYRISKIKISDSTDVTVFDNMIGCDSPVIACGDMVYFGANARKKSDATVKVLNTKTNEIKSTRVRYGPDLHVAKSVPIKNNDVYELATCGSYVSSYEGRYQNSLNWNGVFRSRNDYLATINNLNTPVTKTSDKTMKITYVLQGE